MATLKYRGPSPYALKVEIPREDYVYRKFSERLHTSVTASGVCTPSGSREKSIGVALFGAGRAGSIHLGLLVKNRRVRLLYVVEDDTSKWDFLRNTYSFGDETKLLESKNANVVFKDTNIDAVFVTSPTYTHEKIVTDALKHQKAVFCEKPVAENIESTRACFEVSRKAGRPILTAFNRRFDPAYASVRERVRNGEIGHVNTIKVCSRDSPLPSLDYLKVSGGIFHDCAVHDIDMVIWILGEYPCRVSVSATANIPEIAAIDDFDSVAMILTFPSGTVGMIELCRFSNYGYDMRLEVFGFGGMIKAEGQQPIQSVESYTKFERNTCPIYYSFPSRFETAYSNEVEHFLDVVQGKSELRVAYKDTLAVSKIASACEEAARTRRVVEIKWSPEEL